MQTFAIIPAAGRSVRMGNPKLLLPWADSTVIEHVLAAWRASQVSHIVMVVHPEDRELAERGRSGGAIVVQPGVAPSEMKVSVRIGLEFVAQNLNPFETDAWLLAPADMPGLRSQAIDRVIEAFRTSLNADGSPTAIWAPVAGGRRGHPVVFPWPLAGQVANLATEQGIDALLRQNPVNSVEIDGLSFDDLDTPVDYRRLQP